MACILARGFEHGNIYDLDYASDASGANILTGSSSKRPGGFSNYGLLIQTGRTGYMSLPSAVSECYLQICFSPISSGGTSGHLFKWGKGGTVLGSVYMDATSKLLKLYTGDGATLVATGVTPLAVSLYYILEIHIKIANSPDGVLELRLNGLTECVFTGGDTQPGADTTIDRIHFCSLLTTNIYLDDIVVNDTTGSAPGNTWPSGANVSGLAPSGAGATTQWTPSTGSNYACVDEVPPSATDYVSTNTVDQIDSYAMGDLPAAAAVVLGVEEAIFASRIGISTPTTIKPLVRMAGTDYPAASGIEVPTVSLIPLRSCLAQNPNTTADWTVANVNALELGFKSAA